MSDGSFHEQVMQIFEILHAGNDWRIGVSQSSPIHLQQQAEVISIAEVQADSFPKRFREIVIDVRRFFEQERSRIDFLLHQGTANRAIDPRRIRSQLQVLLAIKKHLLGAFIDTSDNDIVTSSYGRVMGWFAGFFNAYLCILLEEDPFLQQLEAHYPQLFGMVRLAGNYEFFDPGAEISLYDAKDNNPWHYIDVAEQIFESIHPQDTRPNSEQVKHAYELWIDLIPRGNSATDVYRAQHVVEWIAQWLNCYGSLLVTSDPLWLTLGEHSLFSRIMHERRLSRTVFGRRPQPEVIKLRDDYMLTELQQTTP